MLLTRLSEAKKIGFSNIGFSQKVGRLTCPFQFKLHVRGAALRRGGARARQSPGGGGVRGGERGGDGGGGGGGGGASRGLF